MSDHQVISLGCRLNLAEGERMAAMLAGEDVVVINSCAVTAEAVRQTRQAIRRARAARPDARLLVTGCAAEIERHALSAMPEVDGLVANAAKLDPRAWNLPPRPASPTTRQHTRGFVAVQNGCDHACTFCVIPQGRGASRSLNLGQVLAQCAPLVDAGVQELVLTGVDLTSWGHDLADCPRLGDLVAALLAEYPHLPRVRLSSLDGVEIDPLLFDLLAHEARVMPHVHLSLQHGADLILKRMKRRHTRADAVQLVARLKAARPDIAIGADLIAGFPTETDDHHAANLAIIADLGVVHGHIFPYSPRPGTPAARMPQVDRATIRARASDLRAAVQQQRNPWLQSLVGTPQEVLTERDGTGYAPGFARVAVPAGSPLGQVVTVTPCALIEGLLQ